MWLFLLIFRRQLRERLWSSNQTVNGLTPFMSTWFLKLLYVCHIRPHRPSHMGGSAVLSELGVRKPIIFVHTPMAQIQEQFRVQCVARGHFTTLTARVRSRYDPLIRGQAALPTSIQCQRKESYKERHSKATKTIWTRALSDPER